MIIATNGHSREFALNKNKAINSLLYICKELGGAWDMYSLLKILFFAECNHLLKFGRPITGDLIVAMEHGPVPSFSYDEVKAKTIDTLYFSFSDNIIKAIKLPELRYLSESDIECLNESIKDNRHLGFGDLKKKSHSKAYDEAWKRGEHSPLSYLEIAKEKGVNEAMFNYISSKIQSLHSDIN